MSAEAQETETVQLIEYRKAGIDEYQVLAAVSAAPEREVVDVVDADWDDLEYPYDYPSYTESFSVTLPEDGTQVYDPQPEKMNYNATRSVTGEFFTVKDLISGRTVTMNAHEMLCRMVYNEIGADWNEEAIKAQVVAAYSHLRFNDGIGLIPTVALKSGYPKKIEDCVKAVEGQCVYYNGGIANTVYCASMAGYSAECSKIFGVSYGYLKPVVSAYDAQDPNYGVNTYFSEYEIRNILQNRLGFVLSGDVANWFNISSVHSGKYVGTLVIDGGRARMTGAAARKLFGLRSSAFEISYSNGQFCFRTYGYGHGVGMSQWGAKYYADHGYSYDQILRHYYVNTTVRVSTVSEKAMKRSAMTAAELEKEIKSSAVASAEGVAEKEPEEIIISENPAKTTKTAKEQKTELTAPAEASDEKDEAGAKDKETKEETTQEETPTDTEAEQEITPAEDEETEPADPPAEDEPDPEPEEPAAEVAETAEAPQE